MPGCASDLDDEFWSTVDEPALVPRPTAMVTPSGRGINRGHETWVGAVPAVPIIEGAAAAVEMGAVAAGTKRSALLQAGLFAREAKLTLHGG